MIWFPQNKQKEYERKLDIICSQKAKVFDYKLSNFEKSFEENEEEPKERELELDEDLIELANIEFKRIPKLHDEIPINTYINVLDDFDLCVENPDGSIFSGFVVKEGDPMIAIWLGMKGCHLYNQLQIEFKKNNNKFLIENVEIV